MQAEGNYFCKLTLNGEEQKKFMRAADLLFFARISQNPDKALAAVNSPDTDIIMDVKNIIVLAGTGVI